MQQHAKPIRMAFPLDEVKSGTAPELGLPVRDLGHLLPESLVLSVCQFVCLDVLISFEISVSTVSPLSSVCDIAVSCWCRWFWIGAHLKWFVMLLLLLCQMLMLILFFYCRCWFLTCFCSLNSLAEQMLDTEFLNVAKSIWLFLASYDDHFLKSLISSSVDQPRPSLTHSGPFQIS